MRENVVSAQMPNFFMMMTSQIDAIQNLAMFMLSENSKKKYGGTPNKRNDDSL